LNAAKGTLAPHLPASANLKAARDRARGVFAEWKIPVCSKRTVFHGDQFSFDAKKGTLKQINSLSTLPPEFSGRNDVAEIAVHPSGKFLYVSNRGLDSIAVFAIDKKSGRLTQMGGVPTGGKEPRHFALDPAGNFVFVENQ